jgi:fucose permease
MFGLQEVTAVTVCGAFVFGMLLVLLAGLRPVLAERLGVDERRIDGLLSIFSLALIPTMILSGVLTDRLGARSVILVGSVVTSVAILCLARSQTYLNAIGSVLAVGAGGACVSTGSSVLMARAFFPHHEAASQNLGNVFFGLGALVTPGLAELLIGRLGFRRALTILGLVCLLPALAAVVTSHAAFDLGVQAADPALVLNHPVFWEAALVFLLYGPLEGSLGTWAIRYLTSLGFRVRPAEWLLAGFWFTFLAARLVTAVVQQQQERPNAALEGWLLVGLALAAAVFLGNMAGAHARWSAALGLLLVGACLGPIFPTLVGILFEHFPNARGTAYGGMFSVGAAGGLILPTLLGSYARRTSVREAMRIPLVTALLLAVAAMLLALSG